MPGPSGPWGEKLEAAVREARVMGGGSAQVFPGRIVSPLEGLRGRGDVEVRHALGTDPRVRLAPPATPALFLDAAGEIPADHPLAGAEVRWMGRSPGRGPRPPGRGPQRRRPPPGGDRDGVRRPYRPSTGGGPGRARRPYRPVRRRRRPSAPLRRAPPTGARQVTFSYLDPWICILQNMAKKPEDPERPGRIKQLRMIAQIIKEANPKGMPIVYASALGTLVLCIVIGLVTGWFWYLLLIGIMLALTVGLVVFGQIAQKSQYSMLHGQVGAAAAILQGMRGNWEVTPAVAVNRDQDIVHRVVGYPGIVLVSEGPGSRVQKMLVAEKKRVQRVALDVPVYDIQSGDGEGQIPIAKLQRHLMKLPRNLKKPAVYEINNRLKALPQTLPMPKGPLPRGAKMPRPKMR